MRDARGRAYGSSGTAILAVTWPVVESATLTMPSVPAEYSCEPSTLKPRVLQLPLCRRVFQTVSMWPKPLSDANTAPLSLSSPALPGSLYVCTWPDASPTATIGSSGWIACAKRSYSSGIAHTFSNMVVLDKAGAAGAQAQAEAEAGAPSTELFCGAACDGRSSRAGFFNRMPAW